MMLVTEFANTKRCKTCGMDKPTSEYYPDKRSADRLRYSCQSCERQSKKDYRNTESGKLVFRKGKWKNRKFLNEFGGYFNLDDYERWHTGFCHICGTDDPGHMDWNVDHCHSTNYVRGILCHACNTGHNWDTDERWGIQAHRYLLQANNRIATYPLTMLEGM